MLKAHYECGMRINFMVFIVPCGAFINPSFIVRTHFSILLNSEHQ